MDVDSEGPGLADILAGIVTMSEAIVDIDDRISVLRAGSPPNRVFERLNTSQFDSLLAELRDRYDLVIFDTPPAVVAGETMGLANKVDAALLVVRAHQEHRGLVARLINQLSDTYCDVLGILLNRPRGTAGGYFKKNFATMAAYSAKVD
jgi:Mrp family chromosome partitioning ATPase